MDESLEKLAGKTYVSEHLANERTFLAYLRSGIAIVSFGITINRFGLYLVENDKAPADHRAMLFGDAESVGVTMVAFGMALILVAAIRYSQVSKAIDLDRFRPSNWLVWIASIATLAISAVSLVWLFRR